MFTPEEREAVRARLVDLARADPDVVAAAHTGSFAVGTADAWSDIDLAIAVRGDLPPAVERWTRCLYAAFGAVHHWDLPVGATLYRVFLLPGWLEVDVAFTPEAEFGPRGPKWRPAFGSPSAAPAASAAPDVQPPRADDTLGRCWHHVLHAAAAIERGRPWQGEWFVAEARHHVIELACRRLGLPDAHGRGTDGLPEPVRAALAATLVGDLGEAALVRALRAVTEAFLAEAEAVDAGLAATLRPMCAELSRAVSRST